MTDVWCTLRCACKAMFPAQNFISTPRHKSYPMDAASHTMALYAADVRFDNCKFCAHSWVNVHFVAHGVCLLIVEPLKIRNVGNFYYEILAYAHRAQNPETSSVCSASTSTLCARGIGDEIKIKFLTSTRLKMRTFFYAYHYRVHAEHIITFFHRWQLFHVCRAVVSAMHICTLQPLGFISFELLFRCIVQ